MGRHAEYVVRNGRLALLIPKEQPALLTSVGFVIETPSDEGCSWCACEHVRVQFSLSDGEVFGDVICPQCGFSCGDHEFSPRSVSWQQAVERLLQRWLDVSDSAGLDPADFDSLNFIVAVLSGAFGHLEQWRSRNCLIH